MKLFWTTLAFSFFFISCVHTDKTPSAVSAPTAEEKQAPPVSPVGSMNASLKGYKQLRAAGVVHIVSDQSRQLHIEVMLEGMKPGPYRINLNSAKRCNRANAAHGRDLGELIADGKGTAKGNFDFKDLPSTEVVGKKIIIYTKEKGRTRVAACGVVEKL